MAEVKSIYTLEEWDELAAGGVVAEPLYIGQDSTIRIECPSVDCFTGRVCCAHIQDMPFQFFLEAGRRYRRVICVVCGWDGKRLVGKREDGGNGPLK